MLVVALLALGLKNLSISNDFRVYLSEDNPQLIAFESFENNYVKSDSATFVVTAKQGDIFTKEGLTLIQELTERSWLVEYAYRVSSLTNYQYTKSNKDEITTNYFVEDLSKINERSLRKIRDIALSEKRLVHSVIPPDGKLTVIVINLHLDKKQANASISVTEEMEAVRDAFRERYPGL